LHLYLVAAADDLLEVGMVQTSAVSSFDEHLSETNTSCVQNVTGGCIVVLFGAAFSGDTLLNASQIAGSGSV
jgi:hypothetical protein